MKPKQSEDEKLFRMNSDSYRFVDGAPGVDGAPAPPPGWGRTGRARRPSLRHETHNAAGF